MIHERTWLSKATIGAACVLVWTACSMGETGTLTPPVEPCDGGCGVGSDGGAAAVGDAGRDRVVLDGATPATDAAAGLAPEATLDACFDTEDNDGNHAADCAETSCQVLSGACCVGRGTATCCALPTDAPPLDFAGCTGDPSACLGTRGGVSFGSSIASEALALTGDGSVDTGIWLRAPHDLETSRLVLSARMALPACDATCTAFAAIGLTSQDFGAGAPHNVRPIVALVASASLGQVRLLVGEAVVWSAPLAFAGSEGGSAAYELALEPDGVITISRDGAARETMPVRFAPTRDAHVVVYGRSRNPTASLPPALVDDIRVSESLCDVATAWRPRAQVLPMPGTTPTSDFRGPGAVVAEDKVYVAYADPTTGAISLAEESAAASIDARILIETGGILNPPAAERYADPELVRAPGEPWRLFATRVGASASSIVSFLGGSGTAPTFGASSTRSDLIMPASLAAATVSEPAVVYDSGTSTWRMWLHVADAAGHRIVELSSADALTWALAPAITPDGAAVRAQPTLGGFDADEVGSPSVVLRGGTWNLYFAGRHGARWAIGLVASDDRLHWTKPVVVALSASGSGFDALSVRDPSVVTRGDAVELYYVGSDGAHAVIGRVVRSATTARAGAAAGGM